MNTEEQQMWDETWEEFDQMDEAGKCALAAVFLSTLAVRKNSPYRAELQRRGYAVPVEAD